MSNLSDSLGVQALDAPPTRYPPYVVPRCIPTPGLPFHTDKSHTPGTTTTSDPSERRLHVTFRSCAPMSALHSPQAIGTHPTTRSLCVSNRQRVGARAFDL
jgi:hypothetical protein